MFSLATINRMNAAVDRKRRRDRERAAAKRARAKSAKGAAVNRYLQDNDQ